MEHKKKHPLSEEKGDVGHIQGAEEDWEVNEVYQ
jgi:hypothetical protein